MVEYELVAVHPLIGDPEPIVRRRAGFEQVPSDRQSELASDPPVVYADEFVRVEFGLEHDGDVFHGFFLVRIDEQEEFISSQPAGLVVFPYRFLDDFRDFYEYLVPDQVSEIIVDELEIVDVDEEERVRV